jgi:hypothetical protein
MSSWKPFDQSNPMLHRLAHHPEAEDFFNIVASCKRYDLESIARLWISEGIPFAFRESAGVYEEMRYWLSCMLGVHTKDITLHGSARIGFSMAPHKYGKSFGGGSDFDLSIVNGELFEKCSLELRSFKFEFDGGNIKTTPKNMKNWAGFCDRLEKLLSSGYINTFQAPPHELLTPTVVKVRDTMWRAGQKLRVTQDVPQFTSMNARLYRSWDDLIDRVALNLSSLVSR